MSTVGREGCVKAFKALLHNNTAKQLMALALTLQGSQTCSMKHPQDLAFQTGLMLIESLMSHGCITQSPQLSHSQVKAAHPGQWGY